MAEPILVVKETTINTLTAKEVVINPLTVCQQGPAGAMGPAGGDLTLTAPTDIGGNRVITSSITYADFNNLSDFEQVIGFSTEAASANQPLTIRQTGKLAGFSGMSPNVLIYLGSNGTITQTPPVTGFSQILGIAISTTEIVINVKPPILLG